MIFHKRGIATAANPRTTSQLKPAPLGTPIPPIAPDEDPRLKLADWMSSPDNPFFAKALVNRYWKHFLRRGLIEPEDDIRDSNPPSNPELLAALERHFISTNFDLRELIRTITRSHTYQLSSSPNQHNQSDEQNYSRWQPRRLQAEVLLDSIDDVALSRTDFPNLPPGTRAIALPDNSYNQSAPFLRVFGRPQNESVCECERTQSSSLAQSLHLMNAGDIRSKLAGGGHRADLLARAQTPVEDRIRELYLRAFSRQPRPAELQTAVEFITAPQTDAAGNTIEPVRACSGSLSGSHLGADQHARVSVQSLKCGQAFANFLPLIFPRHAWLFHHRGCSLSHFLRGSGVLQECRHGSCEFRRLKSSIDFEASLRFNDGAGQLPHIRNDNRHAKCKVLPEFRAIGADKLIAGRIGKQCEADAAVLNRKPAKDRWCHVIVNVQSGTLAAIVQ
jgi:hypothetical protein